MNVSTILGILIGLALIGGSIALTTEDFWMFINLPSLIMVLGGTIAATLISYPISELRNVFKVFGIVLRNERLYARQDLDELVDVSKLMFQGQLQKADERLNMIKNPFLRTGIQLVLDGSSTDDITSLLQWRIARMRARERAEAQIFRTMAAFAPAFGMLGTLLGLINMLSGMDAAGFEHIGQNMALAMITTLYGIILANLVFKPVALKLERRTEQRVMLMNMVVEGVMMMHEKRSPAFLREAVHSFLAQYEDELRDEGRPTGLPARARRG
ncbi:MAG: MotA/TolQ/ExbB proton channel family protein [Pseudomonadota bacterium]